MNRRPSEPRERILACAYEPFSRRGVRDVGMDEVFGDWFNSDEMARELLAVAPV